MSQEVFIDRESLPELNLVEKLKLCTKCGTSKTLDCFGHHIKTKDGLQTWCRSCISDFLRNRVLKFTCTRCNRKLKRAEFSRDHSRPNGLQVWCKKCKLEYNEKRNGDKPHSEQYNVLPISVSEVKAALDMLCEALNYFPKQTNNSK